MEQSIIRAYDRIILGKPMVTVVLLLLFVGLFSIYTPDFKFDISADSLVLENDEDLRYYRSIQARYESDDYLIITYSPNSDLFAPETIEKIKSLKNRILEIERVKSVISMLDVPLVQSPPLNLSDLPEGVKTLTDDDVDFALARKELKESPLYRNRIVGADGDTTAMQVNFHRDETYQSLRKSRDALREKQLNKELSLAEQQDLERLSQEFKRHTAKLMAQEEADIATIRAIMDEYRDHATLYLGGIPMIVADMMQYIRNDVRVFGIGVMVIVVLLLIIAFGEFRWVFLPMITAFSVSLIMIGFLGFVEWRITVVSSNFLALLLIFVLSLTIHLIVRFRELQVNHPDRDQHFLVLEMVKSKFMPCFYMVATTMVAFTSLLVSGIRPVIDFGWIMAIGLILSLLMTFTLFPATLLLVPGGEIPKKSLLSQKITAIFPPFIEKHDKLTLIGAGVLAALSIVAMGRLTVENRFIDHFKESTEIFQGMYLIDQKLGGTTPFDVVIDAPGYFFEEKEEPADGDAFDEDELYFAEAGGITATSYWFNNAGLEEAKEIHDYLENIDEIGKTLSLASTMEVLQQVNDGVMPDDLILAVIYNKLPSEAKAGVIDPFISEDGNQLRFSVRVFESDVFLKRQELLDKIRNDLHTKLGLEKEQIHLTGMMVLYNNLLQSLFRSQILTLGAVFLAILFMFMFLFRSIKIAIIAIIPNLLTVPLILGLMGALGIPLDIMTITIAALIIGIGVDDTIHYVHRFGEEIAVDWDYSQAVRRSHSSIGRALYYTTMTVTVGFSILALSNFVPTINFGLLTALAMLLALISNLTVLPLLLEKLKPYGTGG